MKKTKSFLWDRNTSIIKRKSEEFVLQGENYTFWRNFMLEIDRIQTLQYMGSKSRMLSSICEPILDNKEITTVIDLFAGTGSVGYALSPYKHIISNDLER